MDPTPKDSRAIASNGPNTGQHQGRVYRFILVALIFIDLVTLLRLFFHFGYYYSAFHCQGYFRISCYMTFEGEHLILIAIGLTFAVLGIWLRSRRGLLVSFVAVIFIGACYYLWYLGTLSVMRHAEIEHFSQMIYEQQHVLPLAGATLWEVFVLLVIMILFIWLVGTLWPSIRIPYITHRRKEKLGTPSSLDESNDRFEQVVS